MTSNLTKIQNWLGNKNIFEIIKDRHRIDTIVQDIDNKEGNIQIEILQFVSIFSLYQKLDKQRQEIVPKLWDQISQTNIRRILRLSNSVIGIFTHILRTKT